MTKRSNYLFSALCGALLLTGGAAIAAPADCASASVLSNVEHGFKLRERIFWKNGLAIEDITHPHSNRFEPRSEKRPVERTYCHATLQLNNGHKKQVWYLIERNWGFASIGPSVEFCVQGLDRWHAYGETCRSLR